MAERPLYTLYKNLKAQNYDVPDDYNKFESALTRDGKGGADNRHAIYENLKAQNFDVPNTYERFYSALFEPRSKTSSRAKGGSVPMSAADRARFSAGAAAISASAQHTMNNAGRYNRLKQRKQKQQKDFGRVNLGTHQTPYGGDANNVVKDDFAYNPETGKAGAYVSSDNENVYSQPEAEQKQDVLDQQNNAYQEAVDTGEIPSVFDVRDKNGNYDLQENINKNGTYLTEEGARNQFDKKLADAYARKKEIEALIAEDHRQHGNPLLSYGASIGASNGRTAEQSDYSNKLATSLALVKQQIGALEAVKQYPTSSWSEDALKALDNTAFTAKTWDFGLTDFATMGQMERIKTKMDNNLPLSGSDKMLLKSKLGADAAAALEDEKMGNIYRWTKIAGQSLPFMADFFLTGGYGGITKAISRGALKFAAKRGMGKVSAAILKNTGIVAGDVIGSYAMAGSEQAMKTGADIMQRHLGSLYQDEKGDYKFGTFDENGNLLHEGGESMGTALYKGLTSAMVENYTEKLFGHSYGIKKGAINFMEKHGMNASAEFFKNIGKSGWYTNSKKWMEKFGINGFGEEVMEEEIGIPLHALLDGDNKFSDLLDTKQQLDIIGGMALSVGSMYAMGAGSRPVKGVYNRAQYYRFRNKVNVADSDAQNLMGDKWADIKDKIDNTTNEQMGGVLADILRQRDTMSKEQINAAINYGINLMKMRGYNVAKTAEMNAREITNEPTTPEEQHQEDIDNAYSEGHDADDADKHDIQLEHEDQMKTLAGLLNISEQQLSAMNDDELQSLTGQNDKLDQAIYDYQLSSARYQGVTDDAQDKIDMAANQAAQRVDMYTDKSRGSVRNATVKASGGAEDYGVYIISGNIATNEDGSINVADSDDMILFYDPTTNSVEHADALRFAELGDEVPADDVKAQAVADAKEKAIKEVAGIVDGTIDVGSQFKVTGADGLEHTYEILADYGDGTAAISIDGNVVENPYSLEDLQQLKDLEDQKRLEAAKAEREQMEKERAEQTQETELPEETKPSLDFNQILNDNGNVVLVDVLDKDGNTKYPDSKLFLIRDTGAKAKVVEMKSDGTFVPHAVSKKNVATISSMSLDEYKQAMAETSMIEENSGAIEGDRGGIEVNDELPPVPDNVTINGDGTYSVDGAVQGGENATAPAEQTEQTPAMTLEDGTIVPMLEDGNPDFSKLTADQTAELYDSQFGEDADSVISGWVSDAKKALDKANNMTVKGKNFVEQKAAKEAKEKAIADAQAAYDSAIAIRDAYNERQLAKVEDTAEGRKELIEKARRKFARLKSAAKDDAEAVSQLYKDVVGSLLHRLYDGTGIDVTDTIPLTAEEYVASNLGAHSLNYEGTETSKGVKQETGLSREDFAKTQLLAADGKGTTIDDLVHSLWENRPSNLESLDTQDIRNALIGVLTSGFKASEARNYIENLRIAQAENILEEQKRAQENAAYAEQHKAESEAELKVKSDEKAESKAKSEAKLDNESDNKSNDLSNETDNEKINDNINDNINTPEQTKFPDNLKEGSKTIEVPEDATDEKPLGEQRTKSPFLVRENGKQQTETESDADVEKNKVDDIKVVDNIVRKKTRKTLEKIAMIMGANIQWLYSNKQFNGKFDEKTNTIYLTLDSSITEGVQFIFGHEMTHEMRTKNPAAYDELKTLVKDMMGEDIFSTETDKMQERYKKGGARYWNDRDAIEEEVVADQLGSWIRDANYAHTLLLKMSHPLLARLHEIVNRFLMALHGTEFSEDMRLILRSIEQAYVKTAKGEVTNSETGEDVSFSLRQKPEPNTSNRKLKPFADYAKVKFSLKDEKIKSIAEKFGVNEDDVAMYANAVERGSTAEAARARANIKRYLLQANEDKISSFKDIIKYTKPINEALKENFGDLDAMIEERRKQVEAQRNAMEAARKRAQEEEEKRQKHLDELSLIPTDELDKRYMDAIANNDESTAREMLDESARRNGYGDVGSDYQGQGAWAAPSNPQYESDEARRADIENSPDVNLEDIALGYNLQPDDYFDNPRAYMNNTAYGLESAHVIKNALDAIKNGEKDVKVKVYRAVPTSVKEGKLRNGDWVTPSKKYAEMHGDNRLDGKYRIIEDEVPANQLWWDGNDVNEFGFDDGKEYRYKNAKNNRKLNDLITYDNKGNVIPPSKRFNSRKSDIRFSLRDMADGKESGAADMAEDLKSLNTLDEVDDDIKTAIDDMPIGWQMANKKMIHIAQALGENRKAEIAGKEPKFSLKDGTLIKAGTYFSGGGLVEEGLKGIIDPVVAVEYDEKISGVYRNNFGQHIVTADVRDVDPKELVKQIDGEVEYFHASPVCKNYSQAKSNHAEVELDKETAASTAKFINAVKPKVVTIENVKGYKDSEAMKIITDALDVNGYTWDADVYNAADYGGYTNRERLIVRAVRDGKLPEKPKKMAHKSGWYEAVEDIIPTMTEKKNGVAPWMDVRLKADGIDWRNIDKPLYVMGSAYADGKVPHAFADELLPTLRTKSGDVIVMPDGKVYRAMGRVLARVSGVSDDYKMPFSENLSHTIIGNGIPTQLTEHVIAPLLTGSDPKFSIRTYHGTGASFDKFDLSHALEGEGSESFGHGVYVTNSSKIGREYAQRAKNRKMEYLYKNMRYPDGVKGDIFKRRVFGEMVNDVATGGSVASAKEFAKKRIGADANDIQRTLENLKDRENGTEYEQNLKNRLAEYKEGLKWIDSLDEEYLTQGNANRYDVEIPDDNGSNYLDWEGTIPDSLDKQKVAEDTYKVVSDNQGFNDFKATPLNDFIAHTLKTYVNTTDVAGRVEKLKSDIKDVIDNYVADDDVLALNEYLKDATPDDVLATIWYNDLVRDIKDADLGEELYRKLSTYVGDNAASQILSDNGLVGIKYPAGMIHGGAKEGDYNYVIFDENNANIVGNTRFSLRYDQFEHDLNQWKKDNNLPKDAQRPTIPQRNAGESAVDFLRRVDEYRKQMALWKTAPTYEQHLLSDDTALGEFNRELQRGSVLKRIAFQDSMLAIRKAQEAIMKEVGVDRLNMAEDAYTAENRSHGKGKNEFEEYNNEFLQPLRKAYHQMKKVLGNSYDNVRVYMMAKHGLERDAQMAFKKSLEADYEDVNQRSAAYKAYKNDLDRVSNDADLEFGRVDFTTWRQKDNALRGKYSPSYMDYRYDDNGIAYDYSGLSSLFDGSDFEDAAHRLVRDVETKHLAEVQALWNATNAATKKILRDGFKAGMMSKDTYEYVKGMYSHYIPLRGWDGTTADQVWDYIGGGKGAFNQTLKTAHGRTSIADDPIAYIENMAESGILLNNKNWVKQHLMLLAQNHPTSLLTLSKAWYVKSTDANGNEEWIPATPQITSQMNSNQVKAAIDAFEQKMEQMAQTGDATQQRDGLNIAYPQTHSEEREHEVRVMKDGEEYVIYVNGDPQLAQAMNNTRAHRVREIQSGKLDRAAAWLGRKMAAAYTSLSPLFIPSNYFRDLTMTLASTAIREDGRYNYLLRKNLATSWNLGFMLRDYQNGKLREKVSNGNATAKEQMFYDFMMNGGETGFVSSLDVEDLKKKFKNDLKDLDRWKANPVKVGHTIMDGIEFLNRAIEDSNRFAVYMTSIQYGRSIDEAVNDAKDVTLNFNRKGTGEYGWQMIRNLYLFINPAVQSLQTLGALAKHHPFKFTAVTAAWLASGVLVPIVNAALMSLLGGDDDKDKYWQFSKWDRRNNAIMWIPFTNEYVKIPLAQEFRAFYGIGDMIASKMMGGELAEETWSQYAEDLLGQVVDMLPLDPTGYDGNIAVSLMPNPIRPVFELAFNVDFTGKPLFKDTEYNKYDPNFTKAYVGTPDWLVRVSKMVNSIGNDYPDVQQNAIDAFGDPRYNLNNPAVVDHVLSSYLGGAYTMGSQVLGLLTKSLNDPKEIKMADIPLVSKFVSNPDDRPVTKKQGDEFWNMKENHDRAANTLSKLKKQAKVDGDYSMLERFYGSEEYKQYKQEDVKVKKYEEDKKKERAEESGEEYRPHKLNAEDVYKAHATPKDDFEDLKLKQLFTKLNGFKTSYDLLVDTAPGQSDGYYNTNKTAIDAIDEISLDKQEISELKKGFLEDGKDAYNAEDMKRIRELRKRILSVLEPANKVVVANQKAKSEKK